MAGSAGNVAAPILAACERAPDAAMLEIDDEVVTGRALRDGIAARLRQFEDAGLGSGDRVIVSAERGHRYWRDLVSLWTMGAVPVPLDPGAEPERIQLLFDIADAAAVLVDTDQVLPERLGAARVIAHEHAPRVPDRAIKPHTGEGVSGAILFTSGSTGEPKGVVLSHGALAGNTRATIQRTGLGPGDRLFASIGFHFTSAICHFLAALYGGATLVGTERRLFMGDLFAALIGSRATCFGGSPVQLRWIAECVEETPPPLKWAMSSGDHLGVDAIKMVRLAMPNTAIHTFYGLTELGGRFCSLDPELIDDRAGSVGQPIAGLRATVRDEDGRERPPGEPGEVYAEGDYLFDGYFRDQPATAAALTPIGLQTGDIGYRTEDGLLYLEGRVDDVFKSAGRKVSTVPIVETLMQTGYFQDVAVIGREHPMLGAVPEAFYVLKADGGFDKAKVVGHLRETLPNNHLPKTYTQISAIPRTGSGKVKRHELRRIGTTKSQL